ncbi:hypothetical protein Q6348_10415 [Isoptericola sp. b441]|uniref:Septation ring formation regulator EzrA n=1 Tax=Actinotalea lenta TaxID=3064654 RepID=A0ABT9DE21_9CELL|nr:hypothetical protein [Isoptericola sp. b441]MDO8107608.1 hypothetical protein [Isoptericola sp. b441]
MSDQLGVIAVIGTAVLLTVLGTLLAIFVASGRRAAKRRSAERSAGASSPAGAEPESTASLLRRANASLVAVDDGVRRWDQELGFAQAQFGSEATAPLEAAVAAAKDSVARAFVLRRQLDDDARSGARRRATASEIIRICDAVTSDLESHAHDFDSERAAQAHAPAAIDELSQQERLLGARCAASRQTLEALSHSYSAVALAQVSANPDLVDALAGEASASLAAGREALERADPAAAASAARAARSAVDRASGLLDEIEGLPAQLQDAESGLAEALLGLREQIGQAERLAPTDPAVSSARSAATAAIAAAQQARTDGDPLGALRLVTRQHAELAATIAPLRDRAARAEEARGRLTEVLGHANAQIAAVNAYVDAHRDAVGAEARTRVADGARRAERARLLAHGEPERALMEANTAARLIHEAQALAERDVSTPRAQDTGRPEAAASGAEVMLGGLLVNQLLRGHGFRGRGC